MSLPRSTYYKAPDTERAQPREQSDEALRRATEHVKDDWPSYGYRRVTHELRRRGIVANHKRVARMRLDCDERAKGALGGSGREDSAFVLGMRHSVFGLRVPCAFFTRLHAAEARPPVATSLASTSSVARFDDGDLCSVQLEARLTLRDPAAMCDLVLQ